MSIRAAKVTGSQAEKMMADYRKGVIVVCPVCGKVDIYPPSHFNDCSPAREAQKEWDKDYE